MRSKSLEREKEDERDQENTVRGRQICLGVCVSGGGGGAHV